MTRARRAANRPNAPSTWSHAPYSSARSAISAIGSNPPELTSPAVATRIAGAPSSPRSASSSATRSSRPVASAANVRTCERPIPSIASAFTALMCTQPLPRTGTGGSPPRPASSTSTPCCPPHQRRAAARPVKFAIVAPLVKTPLHAAGSPNSSLSQSSEICSSRMRERRADPIEGNLVERAGQPVGGERRGRPATHHEVEEARAGRARRALRGRVDQHPESRQRACAVVGQRTAKALRGLARPGRTHRSTVQLGEIARRLVGDEAQRLLECVAVQDRVGHAGMLDRQGGLFGSRRRQARCGRRIRPWRNRVSS